MEAEDLQILQITVSMNAKLIDYEFRWNGNEDEFDENSTEANGVLVLYFSNGIQLDTCVFYDRDNGTFLRSPYLSGKMYVSLYSKYPLGQLTTFEITKSYEMILKDGQFVKKFTKLKYWLYIKARHGDRKKIKQKLQEYNEKENNKR